MSTPSKPPSPAPFATMRLPAAMDAAAPDGSEVRLLPSTGSGGLAHFRLHPGHIAKAVAHRTVEEIWYVLAGQGRLWRRLGDMQETVVLEPGVAITIPVGTHFQFRNDGTDALDILGVTMPPPGPDEAYFVDGPSTATA